MNPAIQCPEFTWVVIKFPDKVQQGIQGFDLRLQSVHEGSCHVKLY